MKCIRSTLLKIKEVYDCMQHKLDSIEHELNTKIKKQKKTHTTNRNFMALKNIGLFMYLVYI